MEGTELFPGNPVAERGFLPNWLAGMRLFPLQLQNLLLESKFRCIEKFHSLGLSLSLKTEVKNSLEKFPPEKLLWLVQPKNQFMFV